MKESSLRVYAAVTGAALVAGTLPPALCTILTTGWRLIGARAAPPLSDEMGRSPNPWVRGAVERRR
jgi:hypothetical protein